MLRFGATLAAKLRDRGEEVEVVSAPPRLGRRLLTRRRVGKWLAYLDKFVLFVPALRASAARADVVHICDHAYSLYTRGLVGKPLVVTCHDLLSVRCANGEFAGQRVGWSGRRYQEMILRGLDRASMVACVSRATRDDLLRLARVPRESAPVIHNDLTFPYKRTSPGEAAKLLARMGVGSGERFLIHVGADVWYKNLAGVIEIFRRLTRMAATRELGLVMVTSGQGARRLVRQAGMERRIRVLTNVSDGELRALYSVARGLLFPSLCEGFGWPLIEAQACGCPVFTSNRAPMTEVTGDAAVYFDPADPEQAAEQIGLGLTRTAELRVAGLFNARRFSVGRMVSAYQQLYAQAADTKSNVARYA